MMLMMMMMMMVVVVEVSERDKKGDEMSPPYPAPLFSSL